MIQTFSEKSPWPISRRTRPQRRHERAGISTLGLRPTRENALDFVLGALKYWQPAILAEVRDVRGNHYAGVAKWAERHNLFASFIVKHIAEQRAWWTEHPEEAATLTFGGQSYQTVMVPSDADGEWVRRHSNSALPDPNRESLREWLARAAQVYRDRAGHSKQRRLPAARWDDFAQHCEWFVRIQVLGEKPGDVAAEGGTNNRAAIERATTGIAELLDVRRRRRKRGRPSGSRENCN